MPPKKPRGVPLSKKNAIRMKSLYKQVNARLAEMSAIIGRTLDWTPSPLVAATVTVAGQRLPKGPAQRLLSSLSKSTLAPAADAGTDAGTVVTVTLGQTGIYDEKTQT